MKKILLNNLPLKIASILIAIVIWVVVVRISDPIVTKSFTGLPVTIENEGVIKNLTQTFTIYSEDETIDLKIRDNDSYLSKLTKDDIKIVADLAQNRGLDVDDGPVIVPFEIRIDSGKLSGNEEYIQAKHNIRINLEKNDQKSFTIEVTIPSDSSPATDYVVGKTTTDPKDIIIGGPSSIVDKIGDVRVSIDVSGMTESGKVNSTLEIYDKNGDLFSDQMQGYLTYNNSSTNIPSVSVDVSLWRKLAGIKLQATPTGEPADGYQVKGITITPEEVTVAGSEEELAKLNSLGNVINITKGIDISGKTSDYEETIEDVSALIPQDTDMKIVLGSGENATKHVVVKVTIMPKDSQEIEMSADQIKAQNLGKDLGIAYNQDSVKLRIQASDELLEKFNEDTMVTATIDLKGKTEGEYTDIPVTIKLPDGYTLLDDQVKISLKLQKKSSASSSSSDDDGD